MNKIIPKRSLYYVQMSNNKTQKLVGIFLLALFLFNFPLINIFGKDIIIAGIPLLYLYIFLVWVAIIVAIVWVVEFRNRK